MRSQRCNSIRLIQSDKRTPDDQQVAKKTIFITGDASDLNAQGSIAPSNNPAVLNPFDLGDVCRQVLDVMQSS